MIIRSKLAVAGIFAAGLAAGEMTGNPVQIDTYPI